MGTYTTNYQLYIPTVGEQGWGTLVNGNFTTIDTTMKSLSNRITAVENEVNGALSCTSVTTSGKITGNGGVGTTSLTTSSTITSTGLITANGGVKGNLTGNVTGYMSVAWKLATSNNNGFSIGTISNTTLKYTGATPSGTIFSISVPNTGKFAGFGIKLGSYSSSTIPVNLTVASNYGYRTINIFWNDTQVYTNTGSFYGSGAGITVSLNLTFVSNKTNILKFTSANGYTDTYTHITPPNLTIYAVPNV